MNARKAQKLRNYLFVIGIVLMLISSASDVIFVIGAVATISGLIPDFLYFDVVICAYADGLWCKQPGYS